MISGEFHKAEVAHDGHNGRIAGQLALFLHGQRQNGDDLVSIDLGARLVDGETAVGIAVKGHADVGLLAQHQRLEMIEVGGADTVVDVEAVRLGAGKDALAAKAAEYPAGRFARSTVGAVKHDAQPRQVGVQLTDDMLHIVDRSDLAAGDAADIVITFTAAVFDLRLDLILDIVGQLEAVAIENLDAVVLHRVVGGRDHDAGVGAVELHKIGNSRCRHNTQQNGVGTRRADAGGKGLLQHLAGDAGVAPDDDAGILVEMLCQHGGGTAPNAHGQLAAEILVRDAADPVGSKHSCHSFLLLLCSVLNNSIKRKKSE